MRCGSVKVAKRLGVFSGIGFIVMTAVSSASASLTTDSISQLIAQKSGYQEDVLEIKVPPARVSTQSSIRRASHQTPVSYGASSSSSANSANYASYSAPQNTAAKVNATPNYPTKAPSTFTAAPKAPAVLPAFLRGSGIAGNYDNVDSNYLPLLSQAESQSSRAARDVLATARAMALNERTIIKGGCWDYLNAVFNRAGVTKNTILKGAYKGGPYANPEEIQVGDWLYYINHGYNDIEHSGLFVGWVDEASKQALILSYAGESRHEPARYKVYDLSHVYHIMRPV